MPWAWPERLAHGPTPSIQDVMVSSEDEDEGMASDHSSSYDGGGDSLTDCDVSPEDSVHPDEICARCGEYQKGMDECNGCRESNCYSQSCVKDCVACKTEVCNVCFNEEPKLCSTCLEMFEARDVAGYNKMQSRLATYNRVHFTNLGSPLEFQKLLDRITEAMGIDPEYELRGEDGLERWPPLPPLPKQAGRSQRTIDTYVRPALLLVPPGAVLLSD